LLELITSFLPPDFTVGKFTSNIRLATRLTAATIKISALQPFRITPIRPDSSVPPVLSTLFFSCSPALVSLQHDRITPIGYYYFLPLLVHTCACGLSRNRRLKIFIRKVKKVAGSR
jgi:hypothetical protein